MRGGGAVRIGSRGIRLPGSLSLELFPREKESSSGWNTGATRFLEPGEVAWSAGVPGALAALATWVLVRCGVLAHGLGTCGGTGQS